jgi:hypothetical protein
MLGLLLEPTLVWTAVGLSTAGLALRVPTAPPREAAAVARTVDSVASSPYEARAEHPVEADEIRVDRRRVTLRTDGTTANASFARGAVVPAFDHDALAAVLRGRPPGEVFADESAFAAALAEAQTRDPRWRSSPGRVLVRRVVWESVDTTLVGGRE